MAAILGQLVPESVHYGVDAPGVIKGLLGAGFGGIAVGLAVLSGVANPWGYWLGWALMIVSLIPTGLGASMVAYVMDGKLRLRDAILRGHQWRGDEVVLDMGAGRGLMAIGAAKRLTTGKVIAVDTWSNVDLSGNGPSALADNAKRESVADRIDIVTGDARQLILAEASVDVVVSVLCLHNIEPATDRDAACREIVRILKPGGTAYIGDYILTSDYARIFRNAGLAVVGPKRMEMTARTLMAVVQATKPVPARLHD